MAGDEGGLGKGFGFGDVGRFGDAGMSTGWVIVVVQQWWFKDHVPIFYPCLPAGGWDLCNGHDIFLCQLTPNLLMLPNDCLGNCMPHPMYCPQFPEVSSVYVDWHDYSVDVNMQCMSECNSDVNVSITVNFNDASTN